MTVSEKDLTFCKRNFELLLRNKIPAIRIANFYTPTECEQFSKAAQDMGFDYYKDVIPKIGRIGITQFEHTRTEPDIYFRKVGKACEVRDEIFKNANIINPLERIIDMLRSEIGVSTDFAKDDKHGIYFSGLIRHIREAFLHFDYAKIDAPEFSIKNVVNQLALNVYFQASDHGGECVVYNQPWKPNVFATHLMPGHSGSYGYTNDVTKGVESFFIKPKHGDLWFFNTRNFHKILYGSGLRLSFSSFIGQTDKKELVLWS